MPCEWPRTNISDGKIINDWGKSNSINPELGDLVIYKCNRGSIVSKNDFEEAVPGAQSQSLTLTCNMNGKYDKGNYS